MPTDGEPRSYRVYLPPGRKYTINYQANNIPSEGTPEIATPLYHKVEPGGYLIGVRIERRRDLNTGNPMRTASARLKIVPTDGQNCSSTTMMNFGERQNDWIINKETGGISYSRQEIGLKLKTFKVDKPLILYCARAGTPVVHSRHDDGKPETWSTKAIEGECDGFMVWIEALPKE